MSTEHKAFIFDYDAFTQELARILQNALSSNESNELITFIKNNVSNLKDPYEGETLDLSWREMIETEDVSQYGDFAITKYYDPQRDIGLGYDWQLLNDELLHELDTDISPLLGVPFGSEKHYFDPGKLGSYFQSPALVEQNVELINSLAVEKKTNLANLVLLQKMLAEALALKKGLYITF